MESLEILYSRRDFSHRPREILPRRSQWQTSIRTQSSWMHSHEILFVNILYIFRSIINQLWNESGKSAARRFLCLNRKISLGSFIFFFFFWTFQPWLTEKLTCPADSIWPNLVVLQLSSIRRQTYILPTVILPLPISGMRWVDACEHMCISSRVEIFTQFLHNLRS